MSTVVVCAVTLFSCRDLVRFRMNLRLPFSVYRVSSDRKMEIARSSCKVDTTSHPKNEYRDFHVHDYQVSHSGLDPFFLRYLNPASWRIITWEWPKKMHTLSHKFFPIILSSTCFEQIIVHIIRRLFLYTQLIVCSHASMGRLAANTTLRVQK